MGCRYGRDEMRNKMVRYDRERELERERAYGTLLLPYMRKRDRVQILIQVKRRREER
jgi:hypothetical protein